MDRIHPYRDLVVADLRGELRAANRKTRTAVIAVLAMQADRTRHPENFRLHLLLFDAQNSLLLTSFILCPLPLSLSLSLSLSGS